jgi:hypothetical protein
MVPLVWKHPDRPGFSVSNPVRQEAARLPERSAKGSSFGTRGPAVSGRCPNWLRGLLDARNAVRTLDTMATIAWVALLPLGAHDARSTCHAHRKRRR